MKTIDMIETAGGDGVLRLEVPVDKAGEQYRVVVNFEPLDSEETVKKGWPPGFFERTAGQWQGELERAPQGEFEQRESL